MHGSGIAVFPSSCRRSSSPGRTTAGAIPSRATLFSVLRGPDATVCPSLSRQPHRDRSALRSCLSGVGLRDRRLPASTPVSARPGPKLSRRTGLGRDGSPVIIPGHLSVTHSGSPILTVTG